MIFQSKCSWHPVDILRESPSLRCFWKIVLFGYTQSRRLWELDIDMLIIFLFFGRRLGPLGGKQILSTGSHIWTLTELLPLNADLGSAWETAKILGASDRVLWKFQNSQPCLILKIKHVSEVKKNTSSYKCTSSCQLEVFLWLCNK